ncbi:MAG: hypothetical protein IK092_04140 [Muribaculaceae bacterium]|nr:hypothetical protein [Muribaculaceae bacterium]
MYTIAQWEAAIAKRKDIEFNEIYLTDGLVEHVLGIIKIPYKNKEDSYRIKKVRWSWDGSCSDANGTWNENLRMFDLRFQ